MKELLKWFLALIISYTPFFTFILITAKLDEYGITTPPSRGGNDIWPLFITIGGGIGLLFLLNYWRQPGNLLDRWLDKILKISNSKNDKMNEEYEKPYSYNSINLFNKYNPQSFMMSKKNEIKMKDYFTTKNFTKIIIIISTMLCLLKMPYWYFQLYRIFGTIGFVYLAYHDYTANLKYTPQIFVALAIIINPILPISFNRHTWKIVDIILAIILFVSIFEKYIIKKVIKHTRKNL